MPDALIATSPYCRSSSAIAASSDHRELSQLPQRTRRRVDRRPSAIDRRFVDLRERVVEAIASLGYPPLVAVDCKVAADRIVLSGSLPSYHLKQMAQVAALRVAGPGRVDNRIVVTSQ
jgi:hypothetical protein